MGMMRGFLVVSGRMVFRSFTMMQGSLGMMFGRVLVMLSGLV